MDFVASCGDKTRFCSFTFKLIALFYLGDTLTLLSWWWKHTHIPLFLPTAKPSVVLIVSFIKHTEVNNRCFLKTACSLPAYMVGGRLGFRPLMKWEDERRLSDLCCIFPLQDSPCQGQGRCSWAGCPGLQQRVQHCQTGGQRALPFLLPARLVDISTPHFRKKSAKLI